MVSHKALEMYSFDFKIMPRQKSNDFINFYFISSFKALKTFHWKTSTKLV